MIPPTVIVSDVVRRFGRTPALSSVSIEVRPGVTGLLGPNGAGKTTLLQTIGTAALPDAGTVRVLGHDPCRPDGRLAIRRRLGYLPQEPGFHRHFTAAEFVDYVAILKEIADPVARREEVRRVLEVVGLLDRRGQRVRKLSGGMRRRLALATALVGDPALLVLDEPTVGLDPEQRLRFRELIAALGERRTVLLSTHQTDDVMSVCQHVVVLHRGHVRFDGSPTELAALAAGHVWRTDRHTAGARASWRTGTGTYRNIGSAPSGAHQLEPSIEDGYLLLLGEDALTASTAA